jgi:hypothetical protein
MRSLLVGVSNGCYVKKCDRYIYRIRSRDSSVGIAMGYGLDDPGSIPGSRKNFIFSTASRPNMGPAQPPIQWVLGVKRPWLEAVTHLHLVPRSRMVELYIHSLIRLHGVLLN